MVDLVIVDELNTCPRDLNAKFTLGNCLFGTVKLTKNDDSKKYEYSCYGIRFDARSNFSINGEWGKNVIIFGVGSVYQCVMIIEKGILVLGEGPTDGLDDTVPKAEAEDFLNYLVQRGNLFKSALQCYEQFFIRQ